MVGNVRKAMKISNKFFKLHHNKKQQEIILLVGTKLDKESYCISSVKSNKVQKQQYMCKMFSQSVSNGAQHYLTVKLLAINTFSSGYYHIYLCSYTMLLFLLCYLGQIIDFKAKSRMLLCYITHHFVIVMRWHTQVYIGPPTHAQICLGVHLIAHANQCFVCLHNFPKVLKL